jgi:hypothetical protein
MFVWGGLYLSGGLYDPATDSWQPTSLCNVQLTGESAAYFTGSEVLVFGQAVIQRFVPPP